MIKESDINWQASVVDEIRFRGRCWFVKRDDLLTPFSGNKARKVEGLLQRDWRGVSRIISHGGAQSNAMLALARLAAFQGAAFDYYTRPLPCWLKQTPVGNLKTALKLGMNLIESATGKPPQALPESSLLVPQGIAMQDAEIGIARLAREIDQFAHARGLTDLTVFLPSGTGATALYLQKHLDIPVATTPCVGDAAYLREQFNRLDKSESRHPLIIEISDKPAFGEPDAASYTVWRELKEETGVEFDLLYDPIGWRALLSHECAGSVMYIHCGGVEGNESMLQRYNFARKNHRQVFPRGDSGV